MTQDGCAIGGTSVFTDAPCFSAADVRGTLFPGTSPDDWIFEGELFGLTPQGGELLVEVAGPIRTGSRPLRGTFDYFVAAGGVCTGKQRRDQHRAAVTPEEDKAGSLRRERLTTTRAQPTFFLSLGGLPVYAWMRAAAPVRRAREPVPGACA